MAVSMLPTEEEHQSALEGTSNSLLYIDNKIASRTSMLYNVLPMVVQSRIPSLPSLRRSVSQFRTHGAQHRKSSSSSSEDEMQRPVTPPPEYRSREGSGSNTPIRQPSLAMTSVEIDISAEDVDLAAEEMMEDYRRTFPSSYEATSGVKWTFARQGLSMVNSARQFAKDPLKSDTDTGNTLVRTLYIDGLKYLLSGLPSDLTPNEIKGLQSAMPDTLVTTQDEGVLVSCNQQEMVVEGPPTLLHRATAWMVCYAMLFMTFIIPYIRLLLGYAYQYEKEHRVGRRLLESSTVTADRLGRRGLQTAQSIFQWNDGMVGDAVNRAVVYGTAGVSGGLRQGIEDAYRAGAFKERKLKTEE